MFKQLRFKNRQKLRLNLILAVVIVTAAALFFSLYRWDNKYTHPAKQAVSGLFVLDEKELAEEPVRFLTEGWEFYPNVLFTPDTYREDAASRYSVFTRIGDIVQLGEKNSTHGSGTYILHLVLPDEPAFYSLELPEIFSAYKLYADDKLMLQMGNTDPQNYEGVTQNRMITFKTSGAITLLLAVTDYSHFYSGLVYPPAFGTPLAVNTQRGVRLGIALLVLLVGVLAGIQSLYWGIQRPNKNALLFSALCFSMCYFTAYSLIHCFALPIFPWYAIEITSGYVVTLLVIIIHNRICKIKPIIRHISNSVAALFCLLTFIYGMSSAHVTPNTMYYYSLAAGGFKLFSACYLLITSYLFVQLLEASYAPQFYAAAAYATLYLLGILFPDFEPVLSGWIAEWGSLILVVAVGYIIWRDIVREYEANLFFAEEHRQTSRLLAMQTEYSRQISAQVEENSRLHQNFQKYVQIIGKMAQDSNAAHIFRYVTEMKQNFIEEIPMYGIRESFCQDQTVNVLLQYYYSTAKKKGISIEIDFQLPDIIAVSMVELCTILGNLLENALEACESAEGDRRMVLMGKVNMHTFFMRMENTYDGHVRLKNTHFLSRKSGEVRFGYGLKSVQDILKQYNGVMKIFPLNTIFYVEIDIPLSLSYQK